MFTFSEIVSYLLVHVAAIILPFLILFVLRKTQEKVSDKKEDVEGVVLDTMLENESSLFLDTTVTHGSSESSTKLFKNYSVLPPELRMMIIDEMQVNDRCRFTRCSKLCNKEAKSSKNYISSLELSGSSENEMRICVGHKVYNYFEDIDFLLKFEKIYDKKWIRCFSFHGKLYWRKELDKSTDLVEYSAEYFKKLLKEHQNKIKNLIFCGPLFETKLRDYDFGIEKLNKLKILSINGHMNVPLVLSKLRRPLNEFSLNGNLNSQILAEHEEIYKVREYVHMAEKKFTNEQFLRLTASEMYIHIGYLTEIDIFNFIRSWQNGTIGKEVEFHGWKHLKKSNFDARKLFRLLGKELDITGINVEIRIKHFNNTEETGILTYGNYTYLTFEVFNHLRPSPRSKHLILPSY